MGARRAKENSMRTVLTIAGSDSIGGAGIQADLKTIEAHKIYGMSAITCVTAQNTLGVAGITELDPDFVALQIRTVFEDIRPDAVKIGMVGSAGIAEAIANELEYYEATNIVVDPVMVASTGAVLMDDDAVDVIVNRLLPLATVVTPNIPEAEVLAQMDIANQEDMVQAARVIADMVNGGAILVKGGHASEGANDLLLTEHGREVWLKHRRVNTKNTHGTGCTLSSAIACGLARDYDVQASIAQAKAYLTGALEKDPQLGRGIGPLNHIWNLHR
jgi:hydroxymethylpyrimidine/phosphomethylpyrimidine kinase